jgi:hypothetical protein
MIRDIRVVVEAYDEGNPKDMGRFLPLMPHVVNVEVSVFGTHDGAPVDPFFQKTFRVRATDFHAITAEQLRNHVDDMVRKAVDGLLAPDIERFVTETAGWKP